MALGRFQPAWRKEVKDIEGIDFQFTAGAISTSSSIHLDFNVATDRQSVNRSKYAPFDTAVIVNNSTVDVDVDINDIPARRYLVGQKTSKRIDLPNQIHSVKITNKSSATAVTAGDIVVEVGKTGMTADKYFRDKSKNVFTNFFGM